MDTTPERIKYTGRFPYMTLFLLVYHWRMRKHSTPKTRKRNKLERLRKKEGRKHNGRN
jgi:hypothetical protein